MDEDAFITTTRYTRKRIVTVSSDRIDFQKPIPHRHIKELPIIRKKSQMKISIRKSIESDLEIFFINQTDAEANYMAAFTPKNPNDKDAYLNKWKKLLKDDSINMQTMLLENKVVGCIVKFVMEGEVEITYALDKEYWGKGLTTKGVNKFLENEQTRPIHGRVAFDNFGSQRILEKVGFQRIGKETGFANARGKEIIEYIYKLE